MKNNRDDAHIREVTRKAAGIMAQIWGIRERKFGGDWERRMMMFNIIVKSIFMSKSGDGRKERNWKHYRPDTSDGH